MFYVVEPTISGVGVLDKAMAVVGAVESEPRTLAELVAATGFSRATTHRLASALEVHGLLRRDHDGRYVVGARAMALGRAAERGWPLARAAGPAMEELRDATGESVQLYVRDDPDRVCVASLESPHGLRTIVAPGAALPLDQGSGGKALLGMARTAGWVDSVAEREAGVASVSAPVRDGGGSIVAAVSVSGPIERLGQTPGAHFGVAVAAAAHRIGIDAGLSGAR